MSLLASVDIWAFKIAKKRQREEKIDMCQCKNSYMKVPTCTFNRWVMQEEKKKKKKEKNVACGSVLNCDLMLFEGHKQTGFYYRKY